MEVGYEKNKEINTGVDLSFYGLLWGTMFYLQPVGGRTGQGGHIFLDASQKKSTEFRGGEKFDAF